MNKSEMNMEKKLLGVEISALDDADYTYVARKEQECRDAIDSHLFALVVESREAVSMGFYTGRPIWDVNKNVA